MAPAITSSGFANFLVRSAGAFSVTATGSPTPALTEVGQLPTGVSFKDNGNGTATFAGTPTAVGSYPMTVTATNAAGSISQKLTLVVYWGEPPATAVLVTSARIPTPSEALAVNQKTGNVYAMTAIEIGSGTEARRIAARLAYVATPAITVLDNDGRIVVSIPVAQDAEYMAVNSKTDRLYVPQWDRSRETDPKEGTDNQGLTIIDTTTNQVLTTIEMPKPTDSAFRYHPVGVAVDEVNNVVYVSATTAEAESGEEEEGIRLRDVEGRIKGAILAFDGVTNDYLGAVTAGLDPESLVFNPTANKVYAANEDDGTLTIVPGVLRDNCGSLIEGGACTRRPPSCCSRRPVRRAIRARR
jgi:DNA-binding beta-propeller fold protein YncE